MLTDAEKTAKKDFPLSATSLKVVTEGGKIAISRKNKRNMDTDTPSTGCEQLPSRVRATILMSGGELAILDGDRTDLLCAMSIEHSYVAMKMTTMTWCTRRGQRTHACRKRARTP